ncbi:Cell wall-binding protein YocH precursor [Clostridium sp. N3C]|nr:Cell wall-binding protein YocH precursor [Clostridium sp. N3C]
MFIINKKIPLGNIKFPRKFVLPALLILVSCILAVVLITKRKDVTLIIDGKTTNIVTYKDTVKAALIENDIEIGEKDKISPNLDAELVDDTTITIKRAVNVTVSVDGKNLDILTAEEDVESLLNTEGIALKEKDKIIPPKETKLYDGLAIDITRVENKTETESSPVEYETVVKTDSSLPNNISKTLQEGENGEKKITYDVVYEDGQEVSRTKISEEIVKEPKDKIVVKGTYPAMPISRGGSTMSYSRVITAKATAYWATNGVGKTYTATGRVAVRNTEGYSTIAVDPRVIPYGTKLFVQGYGFAIAADCGSAIKGNTIDVFFNTKQEALSWGVKYVKVYILE